MDHYGLGTTHHDYPSAGGRALFAVPAGDSDSDSYDAGGISKRARVLAGKRASKRNPWLIHVRNYAKKHPSLDYSTVLKRARASYRSKSKSTKGSKGSKGSKGKKKAVGKIVRRPR
jgi:hypothetical protein